MSEACTNDVISEMDCNYSLIGSTPFTHSNETHSLNTGPEV